MQLEVTWSAYVEVDNDDIEEYGDLGVAGAMQALALLDDAVNRGEGATIVAVRAARWLLHGPIDTLVGRYDIGYEPAREV